MTQPTLARVAAVLEGLEDTLIYKLIDRAQFLRNSSAYLTGASGFDRRPEDSLFEIRLRYHEEMDSAFGRFQVPEERPFLSSLPVPRRNLDRRDPFLHIKEYDEINLTEKILQAYIDYLPELCREGDDLQYGSSVESDVFALQALSRRIHYGAFYVAECKYRDAPQVYDALIRAGDLEGIMKKLTRREVEDRIGLRVAEKVGQIQKLVNPQVRFLIDPTPVARFYRDTIIPLTKEGEVAYLLQRGSEGKRFPA